MSTKVDNSVVLSGRVVDDRGNFLPHVLRYFDSLRVRTGGDTDLVSDIEGDVVTSDGGNRSNRYFRDDIDDLQAQIAELKRNFRVADDIAQLQDQLAESKRHIRNVEQLIHDLSDTISQSKRATTLNTQRIDAIGDKVGKQRTSLRLVEQNINELEERYDSAT